MSRAAEAVLFAFRRQQSTNGVAASWTRGDGVASLTLVPVAEDQQSNSPGNTVARQESNQRNYLVAVQDLVLEGSPTVPARGDRISESGTVWEVLPATSLPAWEYLDQTRSVYLVRTKRMS